MAKARERLNAEANMTKKQIFQNFLYYNKGVIIGIAIGIIFLVYFLQTTVFAPKEDYTIGIISSGYLPLEIISDIQYELEQVADDRNGDGKVLLGVRTYSFPYESTMNSEEIMANAVKLQSDIMLYESMIYIVDNIKTHSGYLDELISDNSGNLLDFENEDIINEDFGFAVSESDILSNVYNIKVFEDFRVVMVDENLVRTFGDKKRNEYYDDSLQFYQKLKK